MKKIRTGHTEADSLLEIDKIWENHGANSFCEVLIICVCDSSAVPLLIAPKWAVPVRVCC